MAEYVLLFHTTPGVLQTRKALQAAGVVFRVQDIPRSLRGGCGLCIRIQCREEEVHQWVSTGITEAVYRSEGEDFIQVL